MLTFVVSFLIGNAEVFSQIKSDSEVVTFIYTSDAHFGISRENFRGNKNVSGHIVNQALISELNKIKGLRLPADGGVDEGSLVNGIDYLIQGGDIANRMEGNIQKASVSWQEFENDYITGLRLTNSKGVKTELLITPGNHDISNAIGHRKLANQKTDPTAFVGIYNLMMKPSTPLTNESFNYERDKINYVKNINGIHFVFINLWPDSAERIWLKKDLDTLTIKTPVVIFTHDQPTCEAKHFNGVGAGFENLLSENYKGLKNAEEEHLTTDIEQAGWEDFLVQYPNIKVYFHGNSNWNEFYIYQGPHKKANLNVFRVDSPMKGKYSSKNEKRLSFQLISLDTKNRRLTVRECFWNTKPKKPKGIVFGKSKTIFLNT
ncbi:hypothetical protein G7074_02290 [Pedobacter sp. HDW13]|uniref:metallophosphoesterase family protein n=1 Tax=unclassified Pedobacter TaxID=2628915 RepID=UPI000F5AFBDB|nr:MULTISPECIES: metallophosphoesterase [unclassified Pedobacter]QIL38206.1 hypothetical protein G7074_02290 [Pedobacter sp. HDW13]RQO64414.1 hypothetical protein DBR40_25670 [Pedobacter sp. KBW01]